MSHRRLLAASKKNSGSLLVNLISCWELEETSGTRVDAHGTNHLTAINNPLSNTGVVGSAAQFVAASSQYLTINSNDSLQTGNIDFTVAFWFRLATSGIRHMMLSKDLNTTGNREYLIYREANNALIFSVFVPTPVNATIAGISGIDQWYYAVAWLDTAQNRTFLQVNNGSPAQSALLGGTIAPTNAAFRMAFPPFGNYLDGRLDQVCFWKRVLTADERAFLYNSGAGCSYATMAAQ